MNQGFHTLSNFPLYTHYYPETTKYYSKATYYGCEHEQIAYAAYKKKAISELLNFSLSKSGLVLDPNYPFLGASPDGTIKCACCKPGVLEIKCPYSCQSESFLRKASESQVFLGYSFWMYIIAIISKFRLKLKFVLHHTHILWFGKSRIYLCREFTWTNHLSLMPL